MHSPRKPAIDAPSHAPRHGIGQVVAAVLVFFGVLALFGARGMHRWTARLPVSPVATALRAAGAKWWGRTAALGLEAPGLRVERAWLEFQEASPLLYPKTYAELKAAKARSRALAAVEPRPTPKKSPSGGPSVLLLGDSIMAGIGSVIKSDVSGRLSGSAEVVAKVATGLARPDVFDWRGELRRFVARDHYDVIVMMLGTNDSQDFTENGRILSYGTEEWVKAYNARLADLMDNACRGADKAVWIGLPPMKSAAFNRKALRINNWARKQAAAHRCFAYVDLDRVVGDDKGSFTSYRKIDDSLAKIRNPDGIHITKAGGALVSEALIGVLMPAQLGR